LSIGHSTQTLSGMHQPLSKKRRDTVKKVVKNLKEIIPIYLELKQSPNLSLAAQETVRKIEAELLFILSNLDEIVQEMDGALLTKSISLMTYLKEYGKTNPEARQAYDDLKASYHEVLKEQIDGRNN
jgi:predicted RNase H-like HicB family nuclease